MQLETLSCNNCGAPLDVAPTTNYARCAHCGSQLAVKRNATAHYTEVLERLDRLDARTQDVEIDVNELQLEIALRKLEEEWARARRPYVTRLEDDRELVPQPLSNNAYWITGLVFLALSPVVYVAIGAFVGGVFGMFMATLLILTLLAYVLVTMNRISQEYNGYRVEEEKYRARRAALLSGRGRSEVYKV